MQDDNHFRSVELAITNPNDLPAYVNAYLISVWQAVQFIFSFRPRERSTEYNELKLSDLKAMLCRFRASIPEMGQPWLHSSSLVLHLPHPGDSLIPLLGPLQLELL